MNIARYTSSIRGIDWLRRARRRRRDARELRGAPCSRAGYPIWRIHDRLRWGALGRYVSLARRIPGWVRGPEAVELARVARSLPAGAAIVEVGAFLGGSAVLLAGARKLSGSGKVHCVDPFDASGDAFSVPVYRAIERGLGGSLRRQFDDNIRRAGLSDWVETHQGTAAEIAAGWRQPIDMLFLDGDQSPAGARLAYERWAPFLRRGGIIALHNSRSGSYDDGHDGHRRLVVEAIRPPEYDDVRCVGTTTFARKTSGR